MPFPRRFRPQSEDEDTRRMRERPVFDFVPEFIEQGRKATEQFRKEQEEARKNDSLGYRRVL